MIQIKTDRQTDAQSENRNSNMANTNSAEIPLENIQNKKAAYIKSIHFRAILVGVRNKKKLLN